ncbi:MAG: hypothetical protein P8P74_04280 [Crocinitomicaceae bacterium]|nr:hypothetical protein [Crocinitomicaceae bacterium]
MKYLTLFFCFILSSSVLFAQAEDDLIKNGVNLVSNSSKEYENFDYIEIINASQTSGQRDYSAFIISFADGYLTHITDDVAQMYLITDVTVEGNIYFIQTLSGLSGNTYNYLLTDEPDDFTFTQLYEMYEDGTSDGLIYTDLKRKEFNSFKNY